jgi:hypothetical protein
MSIYKEFKELDSYIQSVRKLKNYLVIDIQIPKEWKILKKYANEESVVENQSKDSTKRNLSFASEFSEDSVNLIMSNIKNLIKFNKELEEKEKLFNLKVNELKVIFEKQNLENLQELKFDIEPKSLKLNIDEENSNGKGEKSTVVE